MGKQAVHQIGGVDLAMLAADGWQMVFIRKRMNSPPVSG
jgi:hypothetical protein